TYARVAASTGHNIGELLGRYVGGASKVDLGLAFGFLMKQCFSRAYIARESSNLQAFYLRSLGYGVSPDGLVGQIAAAMSHDTEDRLGMLATPTLVGLGTADELIPPELTRRLGRAIHGARIVEIPGGTHGLNFEFAEDVNKLLMEWFFKNDQG